MHYPKSSLKLSTWAICCSALLFSCGMALADDWPQWLGPQRDGVWRETDLVERFPPDGPTIRWRVPVAIGYSGPAVAAGKVYVTDLARQKDESGKPLRASAQGNPGHRACVVPR